MSSHLSTRRKTTSEATTNMDFKPITMNGSSVTGLHKPRDLSHHFSEVTKNRIPSQMKAYYKYFQIPGIGNLAGGLPNVSFFPFDTLEAQTAKPTRWTPSTGSDLASTLTPKPEPAAHITVPKISSQPNPAFKIDLATALQYGTADGYPALRSFLRQFTRDVLHPNHVYEGGPEIVLTCGSTDGFSKTLQLLANSWSADSPINKKEGLIVEKYMYSSILSQSIPFGMNIVAVELDDEGVIAYGPGSLDETLANWDEAKGKRPHMMYTVTMGHNPTSGVLSVKRRKEVYEVACKYDIIIVEDDPYWYLQFPHAGKGQANSRDEPVDKINSLTAGWTPARKSGYAFIDNLVPSFLQFDTEGRVIRLDTFSKTIAPGCRLGWITAQPAFIDRLVRIAEATTQQPSGFVQSMVAQLLLGAQTPATTSAFQRLTRRQQSSFSGWNMSGWVRWLAGLNGAYERRMARMGGILDDGAYQLKQSTPVDPAAADWGVVTKTKLISFQWPKGGMFLWLRIHFENHPLWQSRGVDIEEFTGPLLSTGLLMFLMHKPFVVLASPGLMFSANDKVRQESGWAYFRLCFAAEAEDKVEVFTQRFVDGVQRFWRIKKAAEMEKYIKEFLQTNDQNAMDMDGAANLASFMGC